MNIIDIIIVICCIPPLVKGISRGFVSQAASLLALILGVWLSFKFSVPVGEWLKEYLELPGTVIHVVSFALILTAVVLGLNLLAGMIEKVLEFVMLGWLNSLLGAVPCKGSPCAGPDLPAADNPQLDTRTDSSEVF